VARSRWGEEERSESSSQRKRNIELTVARGRVRVLKKIQGYDVLLSFIYIESNSTPSRVRSDRLKRDTRSLARRNNFSPARD